LVSSLAWWIGIRARAFVTSETKSRVQSAVLSFSTSSFFFLTVPSFRSRSLPSNEKTKQSKPKAKTEGSDLQPPVAPLSLLSVLCVSSLISARDFQGHEREKQISSGTFERVVFILLPSRPSSTEERDLFSQSLSLLLSLPL
jgi:hypothetical protein